MAGMIRALQEGRAVLPFARALSIHSVAAGSHDSLPVTGWLALLAAAGACGLAADSDSQLRVRVKTLLSALAEGREQHQPVAAWLSSRGCSFKRCEVGEPTIKANTGKGVYVPPNQPLQRRWWHRLVLRDDGWLLAEFPMGNAITASTATQHPELGVAMQQLLDQGVLDQRAAVMLLLIVEKLRGEASPYHPWLSALPETMDTPLHFTERELAELRGTTLQAATWRQHQQLEATWRRLRLVCLQLLQQAGVKAEPQLEHFLWAHSVYWSRAQNLPMAARAAAGDGSGSSVGEELVEAIVPGLDFCNHSLRPSCWWQVTPAGRGKEATVQLRTVPGRSLAAGQEATISYGDKSNEALLFAYGFALEGNPYDSVMVHCPLPPAHQWEDALAIRMQLLQARGLAPRFFLPASGLRPADRKAKGAKGSEPGEAAAAAPGLEGLEEEEVWRVLEVFVMPLHRVVSALRQMDSSSDESASNSRISSSSSSSSSGEEEALEAAGVRMGVTSALVRLLELKVMELEGDEGTGSLEADQAALRKGPEGVPLRKWYCLVYRAEQKRLVREYLLRARTELSRTMQEINRLEGTASSK